MNNNDQPVDYIQLSSDEDEMERRPPPRQNLMQRVRPAFVPPPPNRKAVERVVSRAPGPSNAGPFGVVQLDLFVDDEIGPAVNRRRALRDQIEAAQALRNENELRIIEKVQAKKPPPEIDVITLDDKPSVPARQTIAANSGQNVLQNTRANERGASTSAAANQSMNPSLMGSAPVPAMVPGSSLMPSNPQIGRNNVSIPSCSVVPENSHGRKPVPVNQGNKVHSSSTNISLMADRTNQRSSVAANSQQSASTSMSISSKAHSTDRRALNPSGAANNGPVAGGLAQSKGSTVEKNSQNSLQDPLRSNGPSTSNPAEMRKAVEGGTRSPPALGDEQVVSEVQVELLPKLGPTQNSTPLNGPQSFQQSSSCSMGSSSKAHSTDRRALNPSGAANNGPVAGGLAQSKGSIVEKNSQNSLQDPLRSNGPSTSNPAEMRKALESGTWSPPTLSDKQVVSDFLGLLPKIDSALNSTTPDEPQSESSEQSSSGSTSISSINQSTDQRASGAHNNETSNSDLAQSEGNEETVENRHQDLSMLNCPSTAAFNQAVQKDGGSTKARANGNAVRGSTQPRRSDDEEISQHGHQELLMPIGPTTPEPNPAEMRKSVEGGTGSLPPPSSAQVLSNLVENLPKLNPAPNSTTPDEPQSESAEGSSSGSTSISSTDQSTDQRESGAHNNGTPPTDLAQSEGSYNEETLQNSHQDLLVPNHSSTSDSDPAAHKDPETTEASANGATVRGSDQLKISDDEENSQHGNQDPLAPNSPSVSGPNQKGPETTEASRDCLLPSSKPSLTGGSVSANEETIEAKNSRTQQALNVILEFFRAALNSPTPSESESEPVQQNSPSSTSISSTTQSTVQKAPSTSGAHNNGTSPTAQKDREPARMPVQGALSSAKTKPTTPVPKQLRISDFGLQGINVEEAFHQEIRKQELQMIWQEDPNHPGKKMMVLTPLVEPNTPKDREQEKLDAAVIYSSDEDSEEEDGDENLEVPPKKLRLANETRQDQPKTIKDAALAMDVDEKMPVKNLKVDTTPKNSAPVSENQIVQKKISASAPTVAKPRTPTTPNGPESITVNPRTPGSTSSIKPKLSVERMETPKAVNITPNAVKDSPRPPESKPSDILAMDVDMDVDEEMPQTDPKVDMTPKVAALLSKVPIAQKETLISAQIVVQPTTPTTSEGRAPTTDKPRTFESTSFIKGKLNLRGLETLNAVDNAPKAVEDAPNVVEDAQRALEPKASDMVAMDVDMDEEIPVKDLDVDTTTKTAASLSEVQDAQKKTPTSAQTVAQPGSSMASEEPAPITANPRTSESPSAIKGSLNLRGLGTPSAVDIAPKSVECAPKVVEDAPRALEPKASDMVAMDVDMDEEIPVKDLDVDTTTKTAASLSKVQDAQKMTPTSAQTVAQPLTPTTNGGRAPITEKPRTFESPSDINRKLNLRERETPNAVDDDSKAVKNARKVAEDAPKASEPKASDMVAMDVYMDAEIPVKDLEVDTTPKIAASLSKVQDDQKKTPTSAQTVAQSRYSIVSGGPTPISAKTKTSVTTSVIKSKLSLRGCETPNAVDDATKAKEDAPNVVVEEARKASEPMDVDKEKPVEDPKVVVTPEIAAPCTPTMAQKETPTSAQTVAQSGTPTVSADPAPITAKTRTSVTTSAIKSKPILRERETPNAVDDAPELAEDVPHAVVGNAPKPAKDAPSAVVGTALKAVEDAPKPANSYSKTAEDAPNSTTDPVKNAPKPVEGAPRTPKNPKSFELAEENEKLKEAVLMLKAVQELTVAFEANAERPAIAAPSPNATIQIGQDEDLTLTPGLDDSKTPTSSNGPAPTADEQKTPEPTQLSERKLCLTANSRQVTPEAVEDAPIAPRAPTPQSSGIAILAEIMADKVSTSAEQAHIYDVPKAAEMSLIAAPSSESMDQVAPVVDAVSDQAVTSTSVSAPSGPALVTDEAMEEEPAKSEPIPAAARITRTRPEEQNAVEDASSAPDASVPESSGIDAVDQEMSEEVPAASSSQIAQKKDPALARAVVSPDIPTTSEGLVLNADEAMDTEPRTSDPTTYTKKQLRSRSKARPEAQKAAKDAPSAPDTSIPESSRNDVMDQEMSEEVPAASSSPSTSHIALKKNPVATPIVVPSNIPTTSEGLALNADEAMDMEPTTSEPTPAAKRKLRPRPKARPEAQKAAKDAPCAPDTSIHESSRNDVMDQEMPEEVPDASSSLSTSQIAQKKDPALAPIVVRSDIPTTSEGLVLNADQAMDTEPTTSDPTSAAKKKLRSRSKARPEAQKAVENAASNSKSKSQIAQKEVPALAPIVVPSDIPTTSERLVLNADEAMDTEPTTSEPTPAAKRKLRSRSKARPEAQKTVKDAASNSKSKSQIAQKKVPALAPIVVPSNIPTSSGRPAPITDEAMETESGTSRPAPANKRKSSSSKEKADSETPPKKICLRGTASQQNAPEVEQENVSVAVPEPEPRKLTRVRNRPPAIYPDVLGVVIPADEAPARQAPYTAVPIGLKRKPFYLKPEYVSSIHDKLTVRDDGWVPPIDLLEKEDKRVVEKEEPLVMPGRDIYYDAVEDEDADMEKLDKQYHARMEEFVGVEVELPDKGYMDSEREEAVWIPDELEADLKKNRNETADQKYDSIQSYLDLIWRQFESHIPTEVALQHLRNCKFVIPNALETIDQCLKKLPQKMPTPSVAQVQSLHEEQNTNQCKARLRTVRDDGMRNFHMGEMFEYYTRFRRFFGIDKDKDEKKGQGLNGKIGCNCRIEKCAPLDYEPRYACSNCTKKIRKHPLPLDKLCLICIKYQEITKKVRPAKTPVFDEDDTKKIKLWDRECNQMSRVEFERWHQEQKNKRWRALELTHEEVLMINFKEIDLTLKFTLGEQICSMLQPYVLPHFTHCPCSRSGSIPMGSPNFGKWEFSEEEERLFRDAIVKTPGNIKAAAEELNVEQELVEVFLGEYKAGNDMWDGFKRGTKFHDYPPRKILPAINAPPVIPKLKTVQTF